MSSIFICWLLIAFIILLIIWHSFVWILIKLRLLFGYKLYLYTKILSYGMLTKYKWKRTDSEALQYYKDFEFVEIVIPIKKRIRPIS